MIGLYVALGGGIGSFLRYLLGSSIYRHFGTNFPYGTFAVNIIGSFLMGVLIEYLTKTLPHSMELRAFLAVGLLGGFTTFSAFSLDSILLFERGDVFIALIYVTSSVVLSVLSVFIGMTTIRLLLF